ncbi:hypothetical protein [Sphaerisporangium aureirubrum]|uniref:Uncharacterized protein n=1 Tax=Sphaerisporangium aureirubrum TaxID=1544736 RepID=A0ABW1NUH0_9ACTN
MARRAADLANVPTRTPEQVRNYCRHVDELLTDMINEFTQRRLELQRRIHFLLKHAHKKGIGSGEDKWIRSMAITSGLLTAALGLRMARAGARRVYPTLERLAGAEIDGLRDLKYGKGKGRPKHDEEKFEV